MKLMLLGAPGAGKGTLAELISHRQGIPALSTGNLLRAAVAAETPLGLEVKDLLARGELVSDAIILPLIKARAEEPDCAKGYILDGVPRTQAQAEAFETLGIEIDLCLLFDLPDAVIEERLSGRRSCRGCGKVYHIRGNPPKTADLCDDGCGDLYIRDDDKPETIQHRLEVFRTQTAPLIDFYKARGKLTVINSAGPAEETAPLVWEALGLS